MNKVLLVIPKSKSMFGDDNSLPGHPHVGISYLVAILKDKNQIKIFDEGLRQNRDELFTIIDTFKPDIIGVTAFSYNYKYFYTIIEEIKSFTKIPVVVGGPHVSAMGKGVLDETKADFAIKGEGEITFPELLEEFNENKPEFKKIDGLIWRNGKEIIENQNREPIRDLDTLSFPDYDAFEFEKYPYFSEKKIPIITSRGCPNRCIYCSVRLSMGQRFRYRSAENVVKEIKYWYDKGFINFEINDDNFTFNKKRALEICDLIIDNKIKINFQLYNGIRVDRIDRELLEKMKEAGCNFVTFGCESGNEEVLKVIKKDIKLDQVRQAVEIAKELNIRHSVNFIIGHPGETYDKALDSIEFAKSLKCDFVNFYNLVPYPGTDLYNWLLENGTFIVPKESYLREISYRNEKPIFETSEFSESERAKVLQMGFDLYEYSIIRFRFGDYLGPLIFHVTRNKKIASIGRNFLLNSYIGKKIHAYTISRSNK